MNRRSALIGIGSAIAAMGAGCLLLLHFLLTVGPNRADSTILSPFASFELMGEASAVVFSPDGKHLAVGTSTNPTIAKFWKGSLCVYNIAEKAIVHVSELDQWVQGLAFSPDGNYLAVAISSVNLRGEGFLGFQKKVGCILLFQFPEMKELRRVEPAPELGAIAFSQDGKRVLASCSRIQYMDGWVEILSVPDLAPLARTEEVPKLPNLVYSRVKDELMLNHTGPDMDGVLVMNAATGNRIRIAERALTPRVIAVGDDGVVFLNFGKRLDWYDANSKDYRSASFGRKGIIPNQRCVWYSKTKQLFACLSSPGGGDRDASEVILLDLETTTTTVKFESKEFLITACDFAAKADCFAIGTSNFARGADSRGGKVLLFKND